MPFAALSRRASRLVLGAALVSACAELPAIEMFTYFGDGSRIGLPSLEVPIEAYPGIPLRSDRLRARRRGMRMRNPAGVTAPSGPSQTITIRAMPEPVAAPSSAAPAARPKVSRPAGEEAPVAPEPEDVPLPADG